ncbi:MAG: DNA repair protein RecO [Verrucomicrobia bacterium]|nr:DNA repair protein RecO [Verrucomicrobiota bacterium]
MEERATGIILRTRPLTETSLIVHWLAAEQGRVATVAKGARRPKSAFRGKLDLFYFADLSFARSRRSELHTLREVSLRQIHPRLRENLVLLQQAAYAAALIEQTTETDTPLPGVYELFSNFLGELDRSAPTQRTVLAFELKLLDELGLRPDLDKGTLSPGSRLIAERLAGADWAALSPLKLSPAQAGELRQFLHGWMIYHLGKFPPGRAAALHAA